MVETNAVFQNYEDDADDNFSLLIRDENTIWDLQRMAWSNRTVLDVVAFDPTSSLHI